MKGYIKELLREGLLTENDNRGFLKGKFGFSDELANALHALSDKHSIWFGNHLKSYESDIINSFGGRVTNDKLIEFINEKLLEIFNNQKEDYQKILRLFKTDNKPRTNINELDYSEALNLYNLYSQSIKDWLEGDGNPNIRNITWDEAERLATRWHDNLSVGGELSGGIMDDKDEIIHKFNDGFMWVLHKDFECDLSKKSMGHCGTASKRDMYLLRLLKGNEEFITGDWDPNEKYIIQLKGKGNKKPVERYHKYILWLLLEWGGVKKLMTDVGYLPDTNFQLSDLKDEELEYVINNAPTIINNFVDLLKRIKNPSEQVQLAAVNRNGDAIQFIKNPSEQLQFAAVKQRFDAIRFIKNPSEEVQLEAVKKDGLAIGFIIKNGITPSEQVQLEAVKKSGYAIRYIDNPSEQLKLEAVKKDGLAISFIKNPSEQVQLEAVKQNGYAIQYIYKPSEKLKLEAVKKHGLAIEYIDNPSEETQLEAVKRSSEAKKYINNPTDRVKALHKQLWW